VLHVHLSFLFSRFYFLLILRTMDGQDDMHMVSAGKYSADRPYENPSVKLRNMISEVCKR
jgi:hypothetical protein